MESEPFSIYVKDHFQWEIYQIYGWLLLSISQTLIIAYAMLNNCNFLNIILGAGVFAYMLYGASGSIRNLIKTGDDLITKIDHFYDNHIIILMGGRRIDSRRMYKIKFYLSGKVRIVKINPELHIILNEPES